MVRLHLCRGYYTPEEGGIVTDVSDLIVNVTETSTRTCTIDRHTEIKRTPPQNSVIGPKGNHEQKHPAAPPARYAEPNNHNAANDAPPSPLL